MPALRFLEKLAWHTFFAFSFLITLIAAPTVMILSILGVEELPFPLLKVLLAVGFIWGLVVAVAVTFGMQRRIQGYFMHRASNSSGDFMHSVVLKAVKTLGTNDRREAHPLHLALAANAETSPRTISRMLRQLSGEGIRPHPDLLSLLAAHPNLSPAAVQDVYVLATGWFPGQAALGALVSHHADKLEPEQVTSVILAATLDQQVPRRYP